ncbi:NAD(P)/FAD-dependent oxidoreductase [Shimia sp. W99]
MTNTSKGRRLYEDMAYGPAPIANSFWRTTVPAMDCAALHGAVRCDTVIIGAGYTGLNAALALAEAGQDVVVLDANQPGWGASGRNGGFCCLGGAKAKAKTLAKRHGAEDALAYANAERDAVDHVAALLERHGIDADTHSKGETLLAHTPRRGKALAGDVAHIRETLGVEAEYLPAEALPEHGFNSPEFHGALTIPIGFALNPMKYVTGLAQAAMAAGVRIFGQSPVNAIDTGPTGAHRLSTEIGEVTARNLIVATNGYSSENLPPWLAGRVLPVQSSIIVTRPMTDDELKAQGWTTRQMTYDSRHLLHYFRLLPDNRMLFGLRAAYRATPAMHADTERRARTDFDRFFPAWRHVETEHFWSGLVALSRSLTPFAGPIPGMNNAWGAMCYHGNGVAMGSYAGQLLAAQITGTGPATPGLMRQPLRRFELGSWRRLALPAAYGWYALQDMMP